RSLAWETRSSANRVMDSQPKNNAPTLRLACYPWGRPAWGRPGGKTQTGPTAPFAAIARCDARSGRQGCLGLLHDGGKAGLVAYGQVGQHLAVEFDRRLFQAGDEHAVAHAL